MIRTIFAQMKFWALFLFSVNMWATHNKHEHGRQFSTLTYNVQMRPILDNNSYKAEQISDRINSYHIVALQESFSSKKLLLQDCTFPYMEHFTDKICFLSFVDSGLSTLTRFPIIESKKVHYKARAGFADSIASKGILLTRLDIDGFIVDVYNTHMQAGDSKSEEEARLSQTYQLIDFINSNSPRQNSIILMGDFNMSPARASRDWQDFNPVHYSNQADMAERTEDFFMLQYALRLDDLSDTLLGDKFDDIDRILFRSGCGHELLPLRIENQFEQFKDKNQEPLSDGIPLMGTFLIRNASKNTCNKS